MRSNLFNLIGLRSDKRALHPTHDSPNRVGACILALGVGGGLDLSTELANPASRNKVRASSSDLYQVCESFRLSGINLSTTIR
jgi:hypothetical protein